VAGVLTEFGQRMTDLPEGTSYDVRLAAAQSVGRRASDHPDIEATLQQRGLRYGDFSEHAAIAQELQDCMRANGKGWRKLTVDKKQALTVIADKIARILSGDPEYVDNWHDIQGYAKLAENRCQVPK
jgi:hypothetical protein